MTKSINSYAVLASLLIITVLALFIASYSFHINNYAVTPDFSGLACAADHLATEGTFSDYEIPETTYEMCWRPDTYPLLQIFHAGLLALLPIASWQLVMLTTGLAFLTCALGIWFIVYKLSKSPLFAFVASAFTLFSPALIRSLVLTPQNLFGYAGLILGIILCLYLIMNDKHKLVLVVSVPLLILLAFTHKLSFGIAGIVFSFWFVFIFLKSWKIKIAAIVSGMVVVMLGMVLNILPVTYTEIVKLFSESKFEGVYHPIWDHPAIWGYIITSLGILGLLLLLFDRNNLNNKIKWLFMLLFIVPLIFSHLPVIGIHLLPNRFVPFVWISLAFFAAYGFLKTRILLNMPRWLFGILLVFLIGTQAVHGYVFMQDVINGWSVRYQPRTGFAEALEWLSENDPEAELLGVQSAINQEILLAPLWYEGHTVYYPWYNLNHRDIKSFTVVNPSSPYSEIINQPEHPVYKRLQALYTIITNPTSDLAKEYIKQHKIDYLITWKRSGEYYKIWDKIKPKDYPKVYESDKYIIFDLQP